MGYRPVLDNGAAGSGNDTCRTTNHRRQAGERGGMGAFGAFAETFLQALTAGLLVGAIYGLMCVGLGLIFGVMRLINFAQGDFLMLGMYVTLYVVAGF